MQAQVINLLLTLQDKQRFACIIVTHDLAVAKVLADEVIVLRRGRAVFSGSMDELLDPTRSRDPYVDELVRASRRCEPALNDSRQTAETA